MLLRNIIYLQTAHARARGCAQLVVISRPDPTPHEGSGHETKLVVVIDAWGVRARRMRIWSKSGLRLTSVGP